MTPRVWAWCHQIFYYVVLGSKISLWAAQLSSEQRYLYTAQYQSINNEKTVVCPDSLWTISASVRSQSQQRANGKTNALFLVPSTAVVEDKMKNDLFWCVTNWTEVMVKPWLCGRCSNRMMLLCDLCECYWQWLTSCHICTVPEWR